MELNSDGGTLTARSMISRRLRLLREQAGLSQRGLASEVGFPYSYISRTERGEQLPSPKLADALDRHFAVPGLFVDLLEATEEVSTADYARSVVQKERTATRIQVFASSTIAGPLQTEEYARALIKASNPKASDEKIDELVSGRMQRKQVLNRDDPPFFGQSWMNQP